VSPIPDMPRRCLRSRRFKDRREARITAVDRNVGLDAAPADRQNDDTIGEKQRLFRIMVTSQSRKSLRCQSEMISAAGDPGQRIELAERLVEDEDFRTLTSARASATRGPCRGQ